MRTWMRRPSRRPVFLGGALLAALVSSAGCSSTSKIEVAEGFDPRVPLRVAVLPFVDRAVGDNTISTPLVALLDKVPLLSDDALDKKHAADVFRVVFIANLLRTRLQVVDTPFVDSLLGHLELDLLRAYDGDRARAARRLGEALSVDAVVFGEVLEWDRSYYVAESIVRAALKVELRDTVTGGVLFRGEVHDYEASGVSKLPIDFDPIFIAIEVFGEAMRGLRNTIFADLSADICRQIVLGLMPSLQERASARPPLIRRLAHSAHAPLALGDELSIVAMGDAGALATFQVGPDAQPVPMTESAPGVYRGTLRITARHRFDRARLTVRFLSRQLQASTMTIQEPGISTRDVRPH